MDNNKFLLEWYYKEVERKNHLENSLNIPMGILTALVAGIYYLLTNYNYSSESVVLKMFFLATMLIAVFFWSKSIYFAFRSYSNFRLGYDYKEFPNANFIKNEEISCKKYFEDNIALLGKDFDVEKLVEENIEKIFCDCVNNYIENNDKKTNELYKCKVALVNCFITLFISLFFFGANFIQYEKENIYKIEIMSDKQPPKPPAPQQPRTVKQSKPPRAVPTSSPSKGSSNNSTKK